VEAIRFVSVHVNAPMRHGSMTRFPPRIIGITLLLGLLALALVVAGMPPSDCHASRQPELSRATGPVVSRTVPRDQALLSGLLPWKVHFSAQPTCREVGATPIPALHQYSPLSRAPPLRPCALYEMILS
jgi:hypothetical protein